jgi:hypothetical protein
MQHYSCDLCGCQIEDQRYVVNIELFPAFNPDELTSADLDVDHLHAVSQSILQGDDLMLPAEDVGKTGTLQFDLCQECQLRFRRDPLGKSIRNSMHFSEN